MSRLDVSERFALVAVLAAFSVSQPVLDLLGSNAEFFLARRAPSTDIVAVALIVGVALPLAVGAMASLPTRAGLALSVVLGWVLAAILARLFLVRADLPDWWATGAALVIAGLAVWLFVRSENVRMAFRYLLVTPLVFTALFLFASPTGAVLAGEGGEIGAPAAVEDPVPLIWMVFDEFPAASLMDGSGALATARFPNFARLAADATWYPNAVTVQQQTEHSVPAMLTGVQPSQDLTPFAGQYPNNAFTVLADSHQLEIIETITHLCPSSLCEGEEAAAPPATDRAAALTTDITIVAGHALLPVALSDALPPIDQGWGFFGRELADFDVISAFWESFNQDPRSPLDRAADLAAQPPGERPPFIFVHALVPHHPWQLLPSGQRYEFVGRTPGTTRTGWGDNEWLIAQGIQRHLLAVGYADFALGEILDSLDDSDMYDDSIVIVSADHGIAVRTNVEHQREIKDDTVGEIAAVPLFVKFPGTGGGDVDHRRAETIDILPTVADAMNIELGWDPDGVSLLRPDPQRTETTTIGPNRTTVIPADGSAVREVARRIGSWFPEPDLFALRPLGAPDVYGERMDVERLDDSGLRWSLADANRFDDVDPGADVVPARITGTIDGPALGMDDVTLAVVVNGVVEALTQTYRDGATFRFQAMVSPTSFESGANRIELAVLNDGVFEAVAPR